MRKNTTEQEAKLRSLLLKLRGELSQIISVEKYSDGDLMILMTLLTQELYRVSAAKKYKELSPEEVVRILEEDNAKMGEG